MPGAKTLREIHEQFDLWRELFEDISLLQKDVESNFSVAEYDMTLFIGGGSSHHLATACAAAFRRIAGEDACAMPASEALFFPRYHLKKERRYLGIFLSRSGETTETVRAMEALKAAYRIDTVAISCEPNSSICKKADLAFPVKNCREESLIMTKSFTAMLYVALMFTIVYAEKFSYFTYIEQLADEGKASFEWQKPALDRAIAEFPFERVTYLGGGPFEGMAREASLKLDEMALMRSKAFTPMELRHGPMASVGREDLIVCMLSNAARRAEIDLLGQMRRFGARVLLLADQKEPLMDDLANALLLTGRGLPEEIRGMLYMPFVQYLACNVALRRGVDPDAPQHLTRVVTL